MTQAIKLANNHVFASFISSSYILNQVWAFWEETRLKNLWKGQQTCVLKFLNGGPSAPGGKMVRSTKILNGGPSAKGARTLRSSIPRIDRNMQVSVGLLVLVS